jgi:hypothetical protein
MSLANRRRNDRSRCLALRRRPPRPHPEHAAPPHERDRSLWSDIDKVDEPQLKAMFETAAEVLGGLLKAFSDYERKNESAWRSH